MSESAHQTTRYGLGTESLAESGEPSETSARAEERDTAIRLAADTRDDRDDAASDAPDDGHHTARFEAPTEPAKPQQPDAPGDVVDDTAEFVRPAPVEEGTNRSRLGAVASRRLGASVQTTGIWIGIVLAVAGFAAIFYTWTHIAALTNVAQQMPYLVSGGISGLVLIIAGATVVDVAIRRGDSKERTAQLVQMTRALAEVRELLESEPSQHKGA